MAIPDWKKFENKVQEHFVRRVETERIIYHRFYDTHSAGSFLPAQPGDHMVIWHGKPILIETKYTSRFASLSSCFADMVEDNQIASIRMWLRAGAHALIAFQGIEGYELWDGAHCAECRTDGKRLDKSTRLKVGVNMSDVFRNIKIPCTKHRAIYLLETK